MDLMGTAPIRDGMEIIWKWGVFEELGFFVLGVFREGEGVVSSDAAAEEEEEVPDVFSGFGGGGGGGVGG